MAGKPLWELILEQFDDLLVKILLLAAIISFVSILYAKYILYLWPDIMIVMVSFQQEDNSSHDCRYRFWQYSADHGCLFSLHHHQNIKDFLYFYTSAL
jgi:hypothetical protein